MSNQETKEGGLFYRNVPPRFARSSRSLLSHVECRNEVNHRIDQIIEQLACKVEKDNDAHDFGMGLLEFSNASFLDRGYQVVLSPNDAAQSAIEGRSNHQRSEQRREFLGVSP